MPAVAGLAAAPDAVTAEPSSEDRPTLVKIPVLGLLLYWFAYALVAPVTIYDSHVYNLARLLIIRKGGFFRDHIWNFFPQICYPWGFDAIHYPFIWLGAGFDLPSFACLVGVLIVVHQLVRRRFGWLAAWWCDLAVLAMPTVVYQATSTKNDLAGVFAVAVWLYALRRWQEERKSFYLGWMALALAFNAGTKLSGGPVTAILSVYTLWRLRGEPRRQLFGFAAALAGCFLVFGSAETYVNNYLLFHSLFGPPAEIRFHSNVDGLAGGVANFVRYSFGTMNVGVDAANPQSPVPGWLTDAGRATLHFLGLNNVGYRRDFSDATFVVLKNSLEASSDYGPLGALALVAALVASVTRLPRDPLWKLSAAGLAAMALTCLTVGWMPWNNRFLLGPFVLFGVAFTLWMLRDGPRLRGRTLFLGGLLLYSAIIYPLHSFNRKPADLQLAWTHREQLELSERVGMTEIVDDLKAKAQANPGEPLLLVAGVGAWTYDILKIDHLNVLPRPALDPAALAAAASRTGSPRLWVLALEQPLDPALLPELRPVNSYVERDSFLYEWERTDLRRADASTAVVVKFSDGWYAEESAPTGPFRWMSPTGRINVIAGRAGTLFIQARVRSITPDNSLEILVDNQPATTQPLPGTDWQDCLFQVPLPAGTHTVTLRSRQPGVQPPGDNRQLTVCLTNFAARLE